MRGKSATWWVASALGAALLVTAAIGRARADEDSNAYTAGEIVGGVIGPLVIVGLVAYAIVRFGGVSSHWAVPAVLVVAALLNVGVRLAQDGGELAARTSCEGATRLPAAAVAPGDPYRVDALSRPELEQVEAQTPFENADVDATQIIDTRDQAGFLVTTLTSTGEPLAEEDVFAGFASNTEATEETEMGGRPARLARQGDRTTIVATAGDCSIVALYGIEDDRTRALAAELNLEP